MTVGYFQLHKSSVDYNNISSIQSLLLAAVALRTQSEIKILGIKKHQSLTKRNKQKEYIIIYLLLKFHASFVSLDHDFQLF